MSFYYNCHEKNLTTQQTKIQSNVTTLCHLLEVEDETAVASGLWWDWWGQSGLMTSRTECAVGGVGGQVVTGVGHHHYPPASKAWIWKCCIG